MRYFKVKFSIAVFGLLFSAASIVYGQGSGASEFKYFQIEPKSDQYKFHHVVLEQKDGVSIELINVLYGNHLILFSLLPGKDGQGLKEIDIRNIKNRLSFKELDQYVQNGNKRFLESDRYTSAWLKRRDIQVVLKLEGKYYLSENCQTEFFYVFEQPVMLPNITSNNIINIKMPNMSVKDFEARHLKLFGEYSINSIHEKNKTGTTALKRPIDRPLLFLSGKTTIGTDTAYKFWQFTDWPVVDNLNFDRGIDRFIFLPGVGIVAGSFDYFFELKLSSDKMMNNYLNEILLMPVSINAS